MQIDAIGQPTASYIFRTGNKFCVPGDARIKSTSGNNGTPITNFVWTIGSISSPPPGVDSLYNIFATPGIFTVGLTVSMTGNKLCPSTYTNLVYVYDTKATAVLDKTVFCLGETIRATVTGIKDVFSWQWFFGDLITQPVIFNTPFAQNPLNYQYNIYPTATTNGAAVVTLKFVSDGDAGCVKTSSVAIQVVKIDPDFKQIDNIYRHCFGTQDEFLNTTPNPLSLALKYSWDFGDQKTADALRTHRTSDGRVVVRRVVDDNASRTWQHG